eukprot:Tamp_18138.p3 GENE.Tamp_18138~~Tamp_18138.p3  ORF type:complete len:102 (+),score=24.23 Tamp_18138:612-917(+)
MQLAVPEDSSIRDQGRQEISNITINITMPDGSAQTVEVDAGQTVEYVRAYLHEHFGVPFNGSTLQYEGRTLIDPMSLCDFGVGHNATLVCACQTAAEGGDI